MMPTHSYLVCAIQRSGSSLLCEALKSTQVAGYPEEYFIDAHFEQSDWAQQNGLNTRAAFVDHVLNAGTSANGMFGSKMMRNYFRPVVEGLQALDGYASLPAPALLDKLLPNLRYIWLERQDKVRQAVSWALAAQTGIYSAAQSATQTPQQAPTFDYTLIDNLYNLVLECDADWQAYFTDNQIEPFKVDYEAFVVNYEATVRDVLAFLAVEPPAEIAPPPIRRQATALNEAWVAQYRAQKWGAARA